MTMVEVEVEAILAPQTAVSGPMEWQPSDESETAVVVALKDAIAVAATMSVVVVAADVAVVADVAAVHVLEVWSHDEDEAVVRVSERTTVVIALSWAPKS
jgi:hypothetical protein